MAAPTSTNEVTARKLSASISALWAKIKSTFQTLGNLVTSWGSTPSDTKYPSEKLVKDSLDGKQATLAFDGTYNASTNKAATVSTVTNAISGLDVSSVGGNGKYISAISETDGKISATATTMDTTPTASSTKAVTSGGVKSALDDKNWFKNKGPSYLQNSNAYYQCISASTNDFSGLVKLYDVTEFFDGTIVNQNERSVFFGDVSLIRDGGMAGCKYARVCAMIAYSNANSNIILQSDDDNAYPVLVKEDFERLNVTGSIGAYVISNGVAVLDTTRTRSRYFVVDCSTYSRMFINAGFYSPSSYSLNDVKAYIFANDSGTVLGNSESTNFDGYVDVPAGATKLYLHTNNGYSQVSVGPTTTSPKYFLAMRYVAGWPAGTIEYFGRFYTRVTASEAYSARPLLLTFIQNLAPAGTTSIPSGYVVQKTATYTTHSAVSDKLSTSRKLAVSLSNTSTDTSFNGSADVTNIKTTGTLGVANGGTGKSSVTSGNYLVGNGTSALTEKTPNTAANELINALSTGESTPTGEDYYVAQYAGGGTTTKTYHRRPVKALWEYIKSQISSVLGLTATSYGGNAATATTATNVSSNGAASGSTARHIWFSDSTAETKRVHDDNLMYTPSTNTVSANISGNAATATTAKDYDTSSGTIKTALAGKSDTSHTHTADAADVVDQPGDSVITDSTDIITTHVNGYSSTNKKLYRRNFKDYVWPWIKDKISSVLGLSTTGYTGNAATASAAKSGSALETAINGKAPTNHASSSDTYGKGTTSNYGHVKLATGDMNGASDTDGVACSKNHTHSQYLTSHQSISGKMNTSANNAASGALQNLTAQLTEGTSDFTDKTEIFTSYAGNNGFAESGHVNQPYRRKASSMLNYIESKRFYTRNPAQNDVGTGTKRIQLGYALKTGAGYCNYLVHVFFNSVAGSLTGCGVTLLVNYDWNTTSQKAKCVILNDNGLRAAGYNIVLANFLSNDGTNQWMHITLGLVKNSEPGTLVAFTYSYCGIFRVNSDVNWVPSIASDTVGSYDQLVQAVLTDADTVDGYHIQFGSYSSRSDTISFY